MMSSGKRVSTVACLLQLGAQTDLLVCSQRGAQQITALTGTHSIIVFFLQWGAHSIIVVI